MDIQKYRKLYLQTNWANNKFNMIIIRSYKQRRIYRKDNYYENINRVKVDGWNHYLVNSKKAFWINKDELCIGYKLDTNPEIYRPIFSHSRQRILDKVHNEEIDDDGNKNQNIRNPYKFWNKIKTKYFNTLYKKRELPTVCISRIIMFIN